MFSKLTSPGPRNDVTIRIVSPDTGIFYGINRWPDELAPFFLLFSEGNKWLGVRILLALVIILMIGRGPKTRKAALLMVLGVIFANELTDLLKAGVRLPRPCVELADVRLRVGTLTSFGTASAHSANMAACATVSSLLLGRWGWIWAGIAFITGLSRIYVGVHYPYQVVFGWICGIATGLFVVWGCNRIESLRGKSREHASSNRQNIEHS